VDRFRPGGRRVAAAGPPFHALGDAGAALESVGERLAAQARDKARELFGERRAGLWHLAAHDGQLSLALGVVEPLVEAAALDRVVEVARAVAGEQGQRRGLGADGAQLGDAHLVFAQVLQQEGLEGLVGAVHLVDQQHRAGRGRHERLQ